MQWYQRLISPTTTTVSEIKHPYYFVNERHIQAIWMEQKYFRNITTSNKEQIEILSSGIWNAEAGPDFRKAHLKVNGIEYFGDVEIHLNDDSWYHHRHNTDERYNDVIFHVSLWKPKYLNALITKNGRTLILLHLEDFLTIPLTRITQLLDLDLYPYKKFIGSGKCAQTLFLQLPKDKIEKLFKSASQFRLQQKGNYFASLLEDPIDQLGAGIAMALGYKNNSEKFLEIFFRLQKITYDDENSLLAFAMRDFGFFNEKFVKKYEFSDYYQILYNIHLNFNETSIPINLQLHQIRPLNHPIRRLALLVKIILNQNLIELFDNFLQVWHSSWHGLKNKKMGRKLLQNLKNVFPTFSDTYWNTHFLFENETKSVNIPFFGDDLKQEIIINTVLPLIQKKITERGQEEELNAFKIFYNSVPFSKNSKTKYLTHRFFGDGPKGELMKSADIEQGAFQVHHDFCVHFEASCEGCPMVDRVKATLDC